MASLQSLPQSHPQSQSQRQPQLGDYSWRLSSHPVTLLTFLAFRISSLLVYILGWYILKNFVLIFILTILLLAADFYYLKNIAGRRLVGLRWWNEVDTATGDSKWVFESAAGRGQDGVVGSNKTDSRFFWLALYAQPAWWVILAIWSILTFKFTWLSIIVVALVLTLTNAVAFSRCDRFSQASNLASNAFYSGGLAGNIASGMFSRFFSR